MLLYVLCTSISLCTLLPAQSWPCLRQHQSPQSDALQLEEPERGCCRTGRSWRDKLCIVAIEGNIGSGKTTLLSGVEKTGVRVIKEPVDTLWRPHLISYYSDPERWGFHFQIEVLAWFREIANRLKDETTWPPLGSCPHRHGERTIIVTERSPNASFHIFTQNLQSEKRLSSWEMSLLKRIHSAWTWTPDHTIYVRTPYQEAQRRLRMRNRRSEENVPIP